jgi:hypothetical protein
MTSLLKQAFIDYCKSGGDSIELANDKVTYAIQHCSSMDYHEVTKFLDELMLCSCGEINHESNMVDTKGSINGDIGIVCLDCAKDGG